MYLAITQGQVVLPDRILKDAGVVCAGGRITQVRSMATLRIPRGAQVISAKGSYICPGFVDVHVHGGGGCDYMDATDQGVRTVNRAHARHGTTTIFPTNTTGGQDNILDMFAAVRNVRDAWTPTDGARIAGVHFYGPYFAPDMVGCHDLRGCRAPKPSEYNRYFATKLVRIATCAAELAGAGAFYRRARKAKCYVTCGHSNASWTEMQRAFDAGVRHVDHFWSVMSTSTTIKQRLGRPAQGSMEQYVLFNREMATEVIADGVHLAPEMLMFAMRMLGVERLLLVTDCSRALDMPNGRYRFGSKRWGTWFESNGKVGHLPGDPVNLASALRGMDFMVGTMVRNAGASVHEAVRMASLTPAQRTGLDSELGSLERGKRADIVVMSTAFKAQRTIIGGVLCDLS